MIAANFTHWPGCYLHVRDSKTGEEWAMSIGPRACLDLEKRVKQWIKQEFNGELRLDGKIMPRLEGDYYATIITGGRPPDTVIVWASGGFFLEHKE